MKKTIVKWAGLLSFVVIMASCSPTQGVRVGVNVRPSVPVYARPLAPSRGHVWVEGDWIWRNGKYVYQQGYWMEPRRGQNFVAGYWKQSRYGWQWTPGRWQRGRRW
ncbi:MAG: hypothetical protein ABIX01_15915 [Chitinophagaceae bacterium]